MLNDTTSLLRGQARLVLRYYLISATTLSDRASAHLVLRYSLISATTLSAIASVLLLYANAPQIVPYLRVLIVLCLTHSLLLVYIVQQLYDKSLNNE